MNLTLLVHLLHENLILLVHLLYETRILIYLFGKRKKKLIELIDFDKRIDWFNYNIKSTPTIHSRTFRFIF